MAHLALGLRTLATRSRSALPLGSSKNLFACQSKKRTHEWAVKFLFLVCMMSVTQYAGAQEHHSSASDYARLYVGALEPQYQLRLWHDMPYYKSNTDFYPGRVSYYGVVYDDVQLRYDQLMQRIAVLTPGSNFICMPEQERIDWFEMDGHRYVHDPENSTQYAALLCDGSTNDIRLYHSVWKIDNGDVNYGTRKLLRALRTLEHYTLVTPDGEMHHVKRLADVAKLFPEQKKQIRQTARKNRLSFSKSRRENSLVTGADSLIPGPIPAKAPTRNLY